MIGQKISQRPAFLNDTENFHHHRFGRYIIESRLQFDTVPTIDTWSLCPGFFWNHGSKRASQVSISAGIKVVPA